MQTISRLRISLSNKIVIYLNEILSKDAQINSSSIHFPDRLRYIEIKNTKNILLANNKITHLELVDSIDSGHRSYVFSNKIIGIAAEKFRRTGKGLKYSDLMKMGLVTHKKQAQDILKYHLKKGNLFTIKDRRPQQYYPTTDQSKVMEKIAANTLIEPSGVGSMILPMNSHVSPLSQCLQYVALQTLEGYVLPLLPEAPSFIHNMHFKTKVLPEYYNEIQLPCYRRNNGKHFQEIIGNTLVDYVIYKSGTVDVQTTCSNKPYKLETEDDRFRIIEFFGQLRAGLINLLYDKHERIVPDILEWELTECDINKDIKIADLLHFSGIKIQVKHLDHLFRIYIKAMGADTICRVEENKHPKKPAVELINDIFNPLEKIEKKLTEISERLDKLARFQWSTDSISDNWIMGA